MKKSKTICTYLFLIILLLIGCHNGEDMPDSSWESSYESCLDDLYKKNDNNDILNFAIRDLDGNNIPEMIIVRNGVDVTVYSYNNSLIKIGWEDFESGTIRLLYSNNLSYPGIFLFTVGGGYNHYKYMSIVNNKLSIKKIWDEDFSGVSKVLGEKREVIEEYSEDKQLIEESKTSYQNNNDLIFQELTPDNYNNLEWQR